MYDTDEVIVPRFHSNWTALMTDLTNKEDIDSWYFRMVYYFPDKLGLAQDGDVETGDVPEYLHMFQHIYRSSRYAPWNVKCFHDTQKLLTIHNHNPLKCLAQERCSFKATVQQIILFWDHTLPSFVLYCPLKYRELRLYIDLIIALCVIFF